MAVCFASQSWQDITNFSLAFHTTPADGREMRWRLKRPNPSPLQISEGSRLVLGSNWILTVGTPINHHRLGRTSSSNVFVTAVVFLGTPHSG